jgi:hypothetical protein
MEVLSPYARVYQGNLVALHQPDAPMISAFTAVPVIRCLDSASFRTESFARIKISANSIVPSTMSV